MRTRRRVRVRVRLIRISKLWLINLLNLRRTLLRRIIRRRIKDVITAR
jgi:hypothetical protein